MNRSIENGIYPSKLKLAKVVPVFKSEDELDPNNCRPTSLWETNVQSFLDKHNLLYQCQYGFREKCLTQHALIDIVDRIQLKIDKKLFSCGIFIDLKKAFDTTTQSSCINLSITESARGSYNNWFSSYLNDRYQTT